MNILVTGITGFIGYSLGRKLVDREFTVFGLVRFCSQNKKVPEQVIPVVGDLTDYYSLVKVVEVCKPEVVIHLGALTPVSESFNQPITYMMTNAIGTINILEAIRRYNFERTRLIVVAGTTEMYSTDDPITELTSYSPVTPYGISKACAVMYAEYMWKTYDLPIVITIPCNTYGRAVVNQRHYVIEKAITQMLEGRKVIYMGRPDTERDFMFREDHINAYLRIIEKVLEEESKFFELLKAENNNKFVFGTGTCYRIDYVVNLIKEMIGWEGEVIWNVVTRPNEPKRIVTSPKRAYKLLNWRAEYNLESGLKKAIEEWKRVLKE